MMNDDTPLGTALHDRVRDEHPDLDRLIRASVSAGTRLRRRRRAGAALATATGVVTLAIGAAALGGSDSAGDSARLEPGPADAPGASGATTIDELQRLDAADSAEARLRTRGEQAPVRVDSAAWRCDEPLDEKFICTQGRSSVVVVWRPAEYWQGYQDPGKAGPETFVSDVHGRFFATVDAGLDTTHAQVVEVGQALVWAE
jgi:hypothetical protein